MTMATTLPYNLSTMNASLEDLRADPLCSSVSPPKHQNKLIPAIYGIIVVLGFIGNGLVVLVLSQRSSQKSVANTYMLNLALSDLLFLTSLPFWAVYYSNDYDWVFGKLMCKVCGWLLSLNVYASIFFITCMSADRCLAIVHPLRSQSRRNLRQAQVVSCAVWAAATLPTIPDVLFRDAQYLGELSVTACAVHYPSTGWFVSLALMKNILGFLVPFAIIATCYCTIGRHLLGAAPLDEGSAYLDRVLRMVVAVVLAFFICWFPFHLLTFLNALSALEVLTGCWARWAVNALIPFALCLGFCNSAINPFLYCFVGNHFREQLARLVQAWVPRLSQKTGSISSRLSSFSRKLSDLKDLGSLETAGQHRNGFRAGIRTDLAQDSSVSCV
ncbi:type-2 angiotensin II receptor-like [Anguilla anguilla]|uniref:type-2 angiotensin II receptor-like n=1 Tax=Anguilla anguilla TaxID=7936 RepID=UPI0015AA39D5|nr:type-2 angiotensin II receptor-like [Anguilla anguilla]